MRSSGHEELQEDYKLPVNEMKALQDLYIATDGDNWNFNPAYGSRWDFTDPAANPCEDNWQGVHCLLPSPYITYHVVNLTLEDTNLKGILPSSLVNLSFLSNMQFQNNLLQGTLPSTIGYLLDLQHFDLGGNKLTGSIPESFCSLSNLVYMSLGGDYKQNNRLTGTLPAALVWNNHLRVLDLSYNHLHGVLPGPLYSWVHGSSKLQVLSLFCNVFSGTLPKNFYQLTELIQLEIWNNLLSGSLQNNLPRSLQLIDFNENEFTGTLASIVGNLNQLTLSYLDLSYNCFQGTIPTELCSFTQLQTLALDCLSCAKPCRSGILRYSAFIPKHPLSGTIPTCLFEMPNMVDLTLGQNSLTGSLPYDLSFSPALEEIYLSYNLLTGRIPHQILNTSVEEYAFADLNNNRFSGELSFTVIAESAYLNAENNRLSGHVPQSVIDFSYIHNPFILQGNLFACNSDRSDLPPKHSRQQPYQCASDGYNTPAFAWVIAVGTCVLATVLIYCCRERIEMYVSLTYVASMVQRWYTAALHKHTADSVLHIWDVARVLCKTAAYCAALSVLVLMPMYAILTVHYGTYSYQYAWTVASVFLSGIEPFALQLLSFLAVSVVLVWCFRTSGIKEEIVPSPVLTYQRMFQVAAACAVYVVFNFAVVGVVNVAFVATSLYANPIYQVYISLFKIFWSVICSPYLTRWLVYYCDGSRVDFFTLEFTVSLMNNIGLPLLAVVTVSPDCLFNLYCSAFWNYGPDANCSGPFYYSYQCAYTYMNYYAAAFLDVCIFSTFGLPLIEFCALQLHRRTAPGSAWYIVIDRALPRILRPIASDPDQVPARSAFRPYFDSTQFLVNQLTFLALILTLGVVSPPLAVALAVTMVATGGYTLLKVGRFLSNAVEAKQMKYVELIEAESRGVAAPDMLRRSAWMLLYFSCAFMTLFLFDTLGDAVGFGGAYWVLVVVPLLPLVLYAIMHTVRAVAVVREQAAEGTAGAIKARARSSVEYMELADVERASSWAASEPFSFLDENVDENEEEKEDTEDSMVSALLG